MQQRQQTALALALRQYCDSNTAGNADALTSILSCIASGSAAAVCDDVHVDALLAAVARQHRALASLLLASLLRSQQSLRLLQNRTAGTHPYHSHHRHHHHCVQICSISAIVRRSDWSSGNACSCRCHRTVAWRIRTRPKLPSFYNIGCRMSTAMSTCVTPSPTSYSVLFAPTIVFYFLP